MPEIKHNFTGGKMNKDLDERLIPNGQYRDAMNVQVSTSEGSDVGTVQNILGNSLVPGQEFIGGNATCVGSIADEKDDKLYWFAVDYRTVNSLVGGSEITVDGVIYNLTSLHATHPNQNPYNIPNGMFFYIDTQEFDALVGMANIALESTAVGGVRGTSSKMVAQYRNDTLVWSGLIRVWNDPSGGGIHGRKFTGEAEGDWQVGDVIKSVDRSYIIQYDTKTNSVTPVLVDGSNSILKLNSSKPITGINIIDDMLFWTDNYSEPKKINITRCIQGTDTSSQSTYLINPKQNIDKSDKILLKEEHITVIKKPPAKPPLIHSTGFRPENHKIGGNAYTGVMQISDNFEHRNSFIGSSIGNIHDFSFLKVGDTFSTIIETDIDNSSNFILNWNNWTTVALKEFGNDGSAPSIPIIDYRIKGKITDWQLNSFTNTNFLLTQNGGMSDVDGNGDPEHWNFASNWTYDAPTKKFTHNGNLSHKMWNNNTAANVSGGTHNNTIEVGKRYKVKYTIHDPETTNMTGEVRVWLFDNNTSSVSGANDGLVLSGHRMKVGEHDSAGEIEHEFVYGDITHGEYITSSFSHNSYLNSILFVSHASGETVGPELGALFIAGSTANTQNPGFGNVTAGTYIGSGPVNPASAGLPGPQWIWNTWEVPGLGNQIFFHPQFIDNNTLASGATTVYVANIMTEPLEDLAEYEVTLTISDMAFYGGNNQVMGISSDGGVGGTVRIANYTPTVNGIMWAQATPSDPWTGKGGQITHRFIADSPNNTKKIDIFAQRSGGLVGGLTTKEGPSGWIEFSIKKVETPGFNGSVSNVSVEELDDTVARVQIRVDAIDGTPPIVNEDDTSLKYAIDLYQEDEDRLFENKFLRFAYRYKYLDGECSAASPFSDIVFSPGTFDYHPKKGYNLGMVNNLKKLSIKDYSLKLPKDVSGIDLLYKEENSPNIYIIDSVDDFYNSWSKYKIEGEAIRGGALPSNQLVRPWDNVPRKALAQEVVGNRVVYGNYMQNYNLLGASGEKWNANLDLRLNPTKNESSTIGKKSVKSLRDYQVGIVFGDKYGRETPILTNNKATTSINKSNAHSHNRLVVDIVNQEHPVNMEYFKFFVKDIGGEYYNLAMDRYYDAEDSNIWLAFPSTDRNKIDIDDYLILKKGAGNASRDWKGVINSVIPQKAQYKVLDIKNEAPDFIKRKETLLGSKKHSIADGVQYFHSSNQPAENDISFTVDRSKITGEAYADLHLDVQNVATTTGGSSIEYHITISNSDTNRVTDRYKIAQLRLDGNGWWQFTLEKPFSPEISDFTNDETGVNSTTIKDNTYLNIYKTAPDNSASHKFDGRFFVKIHNDDIFAKALKEDISEDKKEYKSTGLQRKIYSLKTVNDSNRIESLVSTDPGNKSGTAFFNSWSKQDSVGLNRKVCSDVNAETDIGDPLFIWGYYRKAMRVVAREHGTLNGRRLLTSKDTDVPDSMRGDTVHLDYDAYFRGINVYCGNDALEERTPELDINGSNEMENQAFQDVWFIDSGETPGHFKYSSVSNSGDEDDWDNAVGWKTWPERWKGKGSGIQSWDGEGDGTSQIELAFGGVQPVEWTEGEWVWDPSFYDLEGENTNYSETEGEFIKKIAIGSQFRFKEDPSGTIYTVIGVENSYKVRYETLRDYAGGNKANWGEPNEWPHGHLAAPHLANINYKMNSGKAAGWKSGGGNYGATNVIGSDGNGWGAGVEFEGEYFKTEVEALENSIIWKVSTFCRPSNYTRNWRITVNKAINNYWNPAEDTNGKISQSVELTLTTTGAGTKNTVTTDNITNIGTANDNKLTVGMVLHKYNDGNDRTMAPPAIVTKISEANGTYTIYLKTYNGAVGWAAAGEGIPTDIGTGETLYFDQYPMNGLSPNAAKNLNFFRVGKGISDTNAGTDAVGYTWEWVEEKSSRSEEEILPANPAVWETKLKDTDVKTMDIYHEVTGNIPILTELTANNLTSLIPVGSKIEHPGSKAVPWGTVVHSVDAIAGQIVLSNKVQIEPLSAGNIYLAWLQSFGWTPGSIPTPYGGGGGKIICTELCEQGYITKEVLDLDYRHSDNNMDLATKIGYWKWAIPIVDKMRESKLFTQIIKPFGVAWAREMAHREEPTKYNGNILGKFLMLIGVPLCRYIGNKEISKNSIQI